MLNLVKSKGLVFTVLFTFLVNLSAPALYAKSGSSSSGGSRSSFSSRPKSSSTFASTSPKSSNFSSSPSSTSKASPPSSNSSGLASSSKPSTTTTTSPTNTAASTTKQSSGFLGGKSAPVWSTTSTKPATYGKSALAQVPPDSSVKKGFGGTSVFDKKAAIDMRTNLATQSKQTYNADMGKYKTTTPPVAPSNINTRITSTIKTPSVGGYTRYTHDRTTYYRTVNYTPPSYVYVGAPHYGMWDALFMYQMLHTMQTNEEMRKMYYNHYNDPGFQQWREQANKNAKENEELRKELEEAEKTIASMTGDRNPDYMPVSVPATVVLAPSVLEQTEKEKIPFVLMSGAVSGAYSKYSKILDTAAHNEFIVQEKNEQDLDKKIDAFINEEADAIIGPSDGINMLTANKKDVFEKKVANSVVLYKEAGFLITNRSGNVSDLSDVDENTVIITGIKDSGTDLEWKNLVNNDASKKYAKAKVLNMSYSNPEETLKLVQKNPNYVIFYVGGVNSEYMQRAETVATQYNLKLVDFDDSGFFSKSFIAKIFFNNGSEEVPVYTRSSIKEKTFPSLQKRFFGLWQSSIDTYTVDATMIVSKKWVEKNGDVTLNALVANIIEVQSDVERIINNVRIN